MIVVTLDLYAMISVFIQTGGLIFLAQCRFHSEASTPTTAMVGASGGDTMALASMPADAISNRLGVGTGTTTYTSDRGQAATLSPQSDADASEGDKDGNVDGGYLAKLSQPMDEEILKISSSLALAAAGISPRDAQIAAMSELYKFIPRCEGCGRFLPTQDPTCVNVKCKMNGFQQHEPVEWSPPGYTFKNSRVKKRVPNSEELELSQTSLRFTSDIDSGEPLPFNIRSGELLSIRDSSPGLAPIISASQAMRDESEAEPASQAKDSAVITPPAPSPSAIDPKHEGKVSDAFYVYAKQGRGDDDGGGSGKKKKKSAKGKSDLAFQQVEDAEPLTIKGFEEFDFFVHPSVGEKGWTVSEGLTGFAVTRQGQGHTKEEAIAEAKKRVTSISVEGMRQRIEDGIGKLDFHGSPRYAPQPPLDLKGVIEMPSDKAWVIDFANSGQTLNEDALRRAQGLSRRLWLAPKDDPSVNADLREAAKNIMERGIEDAEARQKLGVALVTSLGVQKCELCGQFKNDDHVCPPKADTPPMPTFRVGQMVKFREEANFGKKNEVQRGTLADATPDQYGRYRVAVPFSLKDGSVVPGYQYVNAVIANEEVDDVKIPVTKPTKDAPLRVGDRVLLASGRHGEIEQVSSHGVQMTEIFGGRKSEIEYSHGYYVKTDGGAVLYASGSGYDVIGEVTPPTSEVIHDPMVADSTDEVKAMPPHELYERILREKRNAANSFAAQDRARKREMKDAHKRDGEKHLAEKARLEKVWDEWKDRYPSEAEKILAAHAPAPRPPSSSPSSAGATMRLNSQHHGVEIRFPSAPEVAVRNELGKAGFTYSSRQGMWYAKQNEGTLAFAKEMTSAPTTSAAAQEVEALEATPSATAQAAEPEVTATSADESKTVYQCGQCGHEFDPRAQGLRCPKCSTVISANESTQTMLSDLASLRDEFKREGVTPRIIADVLDESAQALAETGDTAPTIKALAQFYVEAQTAYDALEDESDPQFEPLLKQVSDRGAALINALDKQRDDEHKTKVALALQDVTEGDGGVETIAQGQPQAMFATFGVHHETPIDRLMETEKDFSKRFGDGSVARLQSQNGSRLFTVTDDRGSELCRVEASQDQFVAELERVRAERQRGIGDFLLPRGGVVRIEEEEDEEREGEKRYAAYLRVDNKDIESNGGTFSGVGETVDEAIKELRELSLSARNDGNAQNAPEATAPTSAAEEAQAAEPEPEGEGDDVEAMMAKMMAELEALKAESKSLEEEAKGE